MNKTSEEKIRILKNGFKMWMDLYRHPEYSEKNESKKYNLCIDYYMTCALCEIYFIQEFIGIADTCYSCPINIPDSDYCKIFSKWLNSKNDDKSYFAKKIAKAHLKEIFKFEKELK